MGSRRTSNTSVVSEIEQYDVDRSRIASLAQLACDHLGVATHQLTVSFVDSDTIQNLNHEYRQKNYPTDVLSFPQSEFNSPLVFQETPPMRRKSRSSGPPPMLGDVIISLPETEKNALDIGQGIDREACFLIVHGILHLCGHDHEHPEEAAAMIAQQQQLMALFERESPPLWNQCVRKR